MCSGNALRSSVAEALLKKLRSYIQIDSARINVVIPISEEQRDTYPKKTLTRMSRDLLKVQTANNLINMT